MILEREIHPKAQNETSKSSGKHRTTSDPFEVSHSSIKVGRVEPFFPVKTDHFFCKVTGYADDEQ